MAKKSFTLELAFNALENYLTVLAAHCELLPS